MNDETTQLLRELSDKFGTTAEHLWGVLISQAPISATVNLLIVVILITFSWVVIRFVYGKTRAPEPTEKDPYPSAAWDDEAALTACLITFSATIIAVASALGMVENIVTGYLNPEYWALKQLLP